MKKTNLILLVTVLATILVACEKKDSSGKKKSKDFESPEEFMENPSVLNAVSESSIEINEGDNFPALAGSYSVDGSYTDASYSLSNVIGEIVSTNIQFYNQTSSGKISMRENFQEISVTGHGGFITGEGNYFTVWIESYQSGSEAGLPDDVSMTVVVIVSGNKLPGGDLECSGISIITEATSSNRNYDLGEAPGEWWMWEAHFALSSLKYTFQERETIFYPLKELVTK